MTALVSVTAPGDQLARPGNQEDAVPHPSDAMVWLRQHIADARRRSDMRRAYRAKRGRRW